MESPSKYHLLEVSKAVKFEEKKKLPKFSHAHMAVINPIHKERKSESPHKPGKITVVGNPAKLGPRQFIEKMLPEHLITPPLEILKEPARKERDIEAIIRAKEKKKGKPLTAHERRQIIEKEKKRLLNLKKLEKTRQNSRAFFKECAHRLDEVNTKEERAEDAKQKSAPARKSIISSFFRDKVTGIRKLFFAVMPNKLEKISKAKFTEFYEKIMGENKITEDEIKDLFLYYCKNNKKPLPKNMKVKDSLLSQFR